MQATELTRVASYARRVAASLERAWENVFDWEHLPWLHSASFRSIECRDAGDWGWRARVGLPRDREIELELLVDRERGRYVSRTLDGPGRGGEIWTSLHSAGAEATDVRVGFDVPRVDPKHADSVGEGFVRLYARLWDEDEAMMRGRARELARLRAPHPRHGARVLGTLREVRAHLPMRVDWEGREFRILEREGRLVAHATVCPHKLGPLGDAPAEDGGLRCPWHGYRFELGSGRCLDAPDLKLPAAPRVVTDADGLVSLAAPGVVEVGLDV